jgi:hypothetical protein
MEEHSSSAIERFFQAFELNRQSGDLPAIVSQFADVFLAVGPQGAQCIRGSDFALALPKRKQLFDSLGCQFTALASLNEIQLDARFVMARTQWKMTFAHGSGREQDILVDSTFIIDTGAVDFKIVFYLNTQDILELLKDRGIQPS